MTCRQPSKSCARPWRILARREAARVVMDGNPMMFTNDPACTRRRAPSAVGTNLPHSSSVRPAHRDKLGLRPNAQTPSPQVTVTGTSRACCSNRRPPALMSTFADTDTTDTCTAQACQACRKTRSSSLAGRRQARGQVFCAPWRPPARASAPHSSPAAPRSRWTRGWPGSHPS